MPTKGRRPGEPDDEALFGREREPDDSIAALRLILSKLESGEMSIARFNMVRPMSVSNVGGDWNGSIARAYIRKRERDLCEISFELWTNSVDEPRRPRFDEPAVDVPLPGLDELGLGERPANQPAPAQRPVGARVLDME